MNSNITTFKTNEGAFLNVDFATVECLLQDEKDWGASVMAEAGDSNWKVKIARVQSHGWKRSQIVPETSEQFIAIGRTATRSYFTYQVHKDGERNIRVSPIGYTPAYTKGITIITLFLLFIIPIMLFPFLVKWHERNNLCISRYYLGAFCQYIEKKLGNSSRTI